MFGIRRSCAVLAAVAVLLSLAAGPTGALMVEIGLPDLAARSERIVMGTVTARECSWDEDGRMIVTRATLSISSVLKGQGKAKDSIVVRYLGGEVGEVGLRVSDQPDLREGSRALLFLRGLKGRDEFTPVGLAQGQHNITVDKASGREMVEPQACDVRRLPGKPAAGKAPNALYRVKRPLEELVRDIRRIVAAEERGKE